jgi:23S rRNA (pseudouridine1915-N3)-methyltransferase
MKIALWCFGKDHDPYVKLGVSEFTARIANYFSVEWNIMPTPKNASLLSALELKKDDYLIALDESGIEFSSLDFSQMLQSRANEGNRTLIFLIGGAFGLDDDVLKKARLSLSLSKLTFPHQLVRLLLVEQLYRACTILKNEKYHHR